jgi:hypothetical protein
MCAAEGLRYHPFHRRAQRHRRYEETIMLKLALFARLEAKPGKEREVADFLESGLALATRRRRRPSGSR